jgi:hypothetical protein
MNAIFLDIDGVLNCREWYTSDSFKNYEQTCMHEHHKAQVDPSLVAKIKQLAKETDSVIVLSSTWRKYPDHVDALVRGHGFEFYGMTPRLAARITKRSIHRGEEIEQWLSEHPEITNFVIFDDDSDMTDQQKKHNFIKTDTWYGLLDEHIEKARQILENKL